MSRLNGTVGTSSFWQGNIAITVYFTRRTVLLPRWVWIARNLCVLLEAHPREEGGEEEGEQGEEGEVEGEGEANTGPTGDGCSERTNAMGNECCRINNIPFRYICLVILTQPTTR